jgi:hypothetical protein
MTDTGFSTPAKLRYGAGAAGAVSTGRSGDQGC